MRAPRPGLRAVREYARVERLRQPSASQSLCPALNNLADEEIANVLTYLPVTNAGFLAFVKANSKWKRSEVKKPFADPDYLQLWADDYKLGSQADGNAPVKYVSWFAAKAYAQWKGKRLPTTAEWE
jgi:hypothetical protein